MIATILSWFRIIPKKPKKPEWAKNQPDIGIKYSWKHKHWLTYCTFCGGNCGQCGQTGRLLKANDGIPLTASLKTVWKNSGMEKFNNLFHGFRKR